MVDKDLSRNPHNIRGEEDIWWYEDPKGIRVYAGQNVPRSLKSGLIPWKIIRAALARKDKE